MSDRRRLRSPMRRPTASLAPRSLRRRGTTRFLPPPALLALLGGVALAAGACGDDEAVTPQGSGGSTSASVGSSSSSTSSASTSSTSGSTSSAGGGEGGSGGEGGGVGGQEPAPAFRNPVDLEDEALALRALQILGADVEGAEGGCVPCHALTEANLLAWGDLTIGVLDECLVDLEVSSAASALSMIECVRERAKNGGTKFAAPALGFWSAGADRDWWRFTFERAYPEDGLARWEEFVAEVGMPAGEEPTVVGEDYDVVGEWFVRGQPFLDELLDEVEPGECDALVTAAIDDHVAEMAVSGWRAVNASNGMLMYGCVGAEGPRDCLDEEADASAGWHVDGQGVLKVLAGTTYESSFWTRGSADGRFVGHGRWSEESNAAIIDLQEDHVIGVDAFYDPGFFPDDAGFVFQGGPGNFCTMDVLAGAPDLVSMTELGCSSLDAVGLYQHVGAALGGGDYFAVDGPFVSDDGGHSVTRENPEAYFGSNSAAFLIPMIFDGTAFQTVDKIRVDTPQAGDAVLSQSARLLVSRMRGTSNEQSGYSLRRVDATPDGNGSYDIDAPVIGRYCIKGGKPALSYDERWMVIHHYVEDTDADAQELGFVDRDDPGFASYQDLGAANIHLVELATGATVRVTNMPPGRYALFPYFRNDGWIYFISRTSKQGDAEIVMASDAALVAEGL